MLGHRRRTSNGWTRPGLAVRQLVSRLHPGSCLLLLRGRRCGLVRLVLLLLELHLIGSRRALERLERRQGRHWVQKRAPQSARMDAAGTKIDAKWSLDAEKTNFVTQLSRESVLVCFSIDIWHFCEVSKASEVPRLSAKTEVRPFALWIALEPRKTY